ncbi:MAG TPA: hypothetical protein VMF32_10540 [Xanthobacteraceae bacterium]|nr:hypothetical protein [Xanthobacteraceae bacterium]
MPQPNPASPKSRATTEPVRAPVDKFTDGNIQVSIWENSGPKGAFRTATLQLRYRDAKRGWQTDTSYGSADLQHLESAAREARTRIENWHQRNSASPGPNTGG